jgi:hypothetical protein
MRGPLPIQGSKLVLAPANMVLLHHQSFCSDGASLLTLAFSVKHPSGLQPNFDGTGPRFGG